MNAFIVAHSWPTACSVRADCVRSDRGRDDECLGVMHDERSERPGRAFHHGLLALDQIQHVHGPLRVVEDRAGEPVAARFNELQLVQARPLLAPAGSLAPAARRG